MYPNLIIVIVALVTLAYTLVGLRAMLHIDSAFGPRYLPRTYWGTWLAIVIWPAAWASAWLRSRRRCNRRVAS